MSSRVFKYIRREGGSSRHCCVPCCGADQRFNSALSFHTFPLDQDTRSEWTHSIRRQDLNITPDTRVCSRHFKSEDVVEPSPTGRRLLKKGAVPALFLWNNYSTPGQKRDVSTPGQKRKVSTPWQKRDVSTPGQKRKVSTPEQKRDVSTPGQKRDVSTPGQKRDVSTPAPTDVQQLDHDYCLVSQSAAVGLTLDHTEDLRQEVERLRRQVEELSVRQSFCLGRFAASDDDIQFYTGFETYNHLMAFWRLIEPASHNMVSVTKAKAATRFSEVKGTTNAMCQSLQPIDEFFLFMVHLSVGLAQRDLSHRFNIHQSTVSRIITTWANFLYTVLGSVRIWMSEEAVKVNLPKEFHQYPDTQVVIDCTELRCQTSSSLLLQSEEFSSYKSHCTFKGLIGMAPHGAVTFVSSLYAGSISDKELLKQSGLVSLLKPGMAIMVDNSFLVDDCVPCKIYRPAYLSKREQMSADEVKSIARLRVHFECLICRVKQHKLFDTVMPLSITGSINQLYTVACLLINYQNGPLVKAWAKDKA